MCFSPQADVVGGLVVGAIGIDVLRHVGNRRDHLGMALLPVLLAAHQLDEAFVWWGLQGHVAPQVGRIAMWAYLAFAFVVLPIYLPLAVLLLEPPGRRRATILPFVALGVIVAGILFAALLRGPVTAHLAQNHLAYGIGLHARVPIVGAYIVATCGSLIFSRYHHIVIFGAVNLIAIAVLVRLAIDGFASLWCAWAALTSAAIAVQLRFAGADHTVAPALR